MPLVLLCLLLAGLYLNTWISARRFKTFLTANDPQSRLQFYRGSLIKSVLIFGGGAFAALACLSPFKTGFPEPWPEFGGIVPSGWRMGLWCLCVLFGLVILTISGLGGVQWRRLKASVSRDRLPSGLGTLLPRNGTERLWGLLLSLNAGVSEELFFRLILPLLFQIVIGNIWLSVGLSCLLFGLGHAYQGLSGVLMTLMAGVWLSLIVVLSQDIWPSILAHIGIDAWSLWLVPAILGDDKSEDDIIVKSREI